MLQSVFLFVKPAVRGAISSLALVFFATGVLAQSDDPIAVSVTQPKTSILTQELRLSGTLTAEKRADLSPRVDGLVESVMVDAGDVVKRGDTLLQQDSALADKALKRAQASRAQAQANATEAQRLVNEAQRLVEGKHLPQTELATRQANLASAQALLAAAEAELQEQRELFERHRLPAPFDGVIARKQTEAGEWVTRGTSVLQLVAISPIRLDVEAPQERFQELRPDTPVRVYPDALQGTALPGRVTALVPVGDRLARSFLVRVVIDDPRQLLPGMSATAVFDISPESHEALLVPRDALLRHPDGSYSLFTVERQGTQQVARRHQVKVGRSGTEGVEVLEGLEAGLSVVTRGNEVLEDGQPVRILDDKS